jgi:redox-sensitive bicupin YhaK (pirin superfamily)
VHVVRGSVWANGVQLHGGDALKLTREPSVKLVDAVDAEVLVFDLPG